MCWRGIVTNWFRTENLVLSGLLRRLVQANMIPIALIDNDMLHAILITQMMLETLTALMVDPATQDEINHVYHMNTKEVMMWDLNSKNAKQIKMLEQRTGVNLDHYHKLKIT